MQGYFLVQPDEADRYGVLCELHPKFAKDEIPEEQQKLYLEVVRTNSTIKSLKYAKEDLKFKYFQRLLGIARAGLVGETAQAQLAMKSMMKLKEEMVLIEGPRIKNEYMKRLGLIAFTFIVILSITAYLLNYFFDNNYEMYCVTFIGALCGTWISYGARQITLKFKHLSLLEEDMMNPFIRLLYMGVCSVILLFFLNTNIIQINIGSISSKDIPTSIELQFAIGAICGLIERSMGSRLYKTAKSAFQDDEEKNAVSPEGLAGSGDSTNGPKEDVPKTSDSTASTSDSTANTGESTTRTNDGIAKPKESTVTRTKKTEGTASDAEQAEQDKVEAAATGLVKSKGKQ